MNLLISLRAEALKTKRTAALYFTLVGAAVIPLMFLMNIFTDGLPDGNKSNKDPLNAIFSMATEINGLGILPMFVILVCTLLPQIEHRNNTWKQMLTSPQKRLNVFVAKFLSIHLLILLFFVASHLFMWVVAVTAHFALPELNVLQQPLDGSSIWQNTIHSYATVIAVSSLQFWLGMRFKNFLIPVAIGLAFWLVGTIMVLEYHSDLAYYFPYSFQVFTFSSAYESKLTQIEWTSLGYAAVFLTAGFVDFINRKMVG